MLTTTGPMLMCVSRLLNTSYKGTLSYKGGMLQAAAPRVFGINLARVELDGEGMVLDICRKVISRK